VIGAELELTVLTLPVIRYDMLELPEECPDYDYGLKVRSKEQQAAVDTAVAGTAVIRRAQNMTTGSKSARKSSKQLSAQL
jgi:hypothetical protein